MRKPETIQDLAKSILAQFKDVAYPAHRVTWSIVHLLHEFAIGNLEDAIFFNNAGGLPFDLWNDTETVRSMVDHISNDRLYAYRLDGKDHIFRLPLVENRFMHWLPPDVWERAVEEVNDKKRKLRQSKA